MKKLDDIDRRLVALLQDNARLSTVHLARTVGLSRSAVQERIARLEQSGVIAQYTVRLGSSGDPLRAWLLLRYADGFGCDDVMPHLEALPQVQACHSVAGETDMLVLVLFAASLHFIAGPGGMHSFGHAAYFGLGAYAAALLLKYMKVPMEVGLLSAPVLAATGALIIGWLAARLSGVYFAMLTLAGAQIIWSYAFQSDFTEGENGILGLRRASWAASREAYYYLVLVLSAGGVMCLGLMGRVLVDLRGGNRDAQRKTAGGTGGLSGVRACCVYALASPAAGWGENQKYAK